MSVRAVGLPVISSYIEICHYVTASPLSWETRE